jgi:NADH-quinone oxidoreductase subunit C
LSQDQDPGGAQPEPEPQPLAVHGLPAEDVRGTTVVHTDVARYDGLLQALHGEGYRFCADLCAVDHLTRASRPPLPDGIEAQRFEVVLTLRDLPAHRHIRVRCQVPAEDTRVPTAFPLWPGTEAMEREAYDLMVIVFSVHPDLTRILLPDDWEGHPLRKDVTTGKVPVQFRSAASTR